MNGELGMDNGKCGENQVRQIERSVVRMREKLTAIKVGANAALELSAPDADGNFANLGRTWRGLSMAICAIREYVGPSLAEMPSQKNGELRMENGK